MWIKRKKTSEQTQKKEEKEENKEMKSFASLAFLSIVFGFISHLVEELEVAEMPIIEYLHDNHTPFLDFFFKYITKGGFEIFFVLIPVGCYWGNYGRTMEAKNKTNKQKEEVWPFALNFVTILLHCWFILSIFKLVFTRPRPFQVNDLLSVIEEVKIVEFSYPSGHASASSLCWSFLYMSYYDVKKKHNIFIILFGVIACILVGISRVYFGVHYPHDIVAGYAMGISITILFRKYHNGKTRLWLCLSEILLGFILYFTLTVDMLNHHPGVIFSPCFVGYILYFTLVYKNDSLPVCSPLRLLSAPPVDLPTWKRIARLIIGIFVMFTVPFPIVFMVIKMNYYMGIFYAAMVFSFLLIFIPAIFPLFNLHRV